MDDIIIRIKLSLVKLKNWIDKNGWVTYDPNDIKGDPLFLALLKNQNILKKIFLYFFYSIEVFFPVGLRRIFKINPNITAGGMGFLAVGFIELYKATGDILSLNQVKQILDWLKDNHLKGYENYCWGFPFDWQSITLIPQNTPIGYTTAECIRPFIEFFKTTKDEKYLKTAISGCKFLVNNLNKKNHNNNGVSFSYTPLDEAQVINSNAIIAAAVSEVGYLANISEFVSIGERIIQFVLNEQLANGSWYYFAYNYKNNPSVIDNYHTAMVLQSLAKILFLEEDIKKKNNYRKALIRGLEFYLNHLFTPQKGMPKMTPNKIYPIDIASCAEAITLFCQINNIKNEISLDLWEKIQKINKKLICWTIDNMQEKNGAFVERNYGFIKIKFHSMRWGQAFMLRSLALSYQLFCQ